MTKLRSPLFLFFLVAIIVATLVMSAHADGLQWQIPGGIGTVQLPTDPTAILPTMGYDFVKKQVIAGGATPLVTLFKEINGYVGAVGEWQTQAPNIQPYLAVGADFAKYVPVLKNIQNLEVHAFVRYVADSGNHLGAGGALAYRFQGPVASPSVPSVPAPVTTPAPTISGI